MRPAVRLVAVLAPLVLAQPGCALLGAVLQKPALSLKDVRITGLDFQGIAATFVVGVDNPNPIGLELARLQYQLTIDGHQLVAGEANQAVSVPPQASGVVQLPVAIKFADFAQAIEAVFTRDTLPYHLAATLGFASPVGVISVPLATDGTFPAPRLPGVRFAGVDLGALDFTGARVDLRIEVTNPNRFALPLGALAYRVTIAGSRVIESVAPPRSLAAGATQAIAVAARLDFLGAGLAVMNAVRARTATVAFDGTLDLGFFRKPIHLEQRL